MEKLILCNMPEDIHVVVFTYYILIYYVSAITKFRKFFY